MKKMIGYIEEFFNEVFATLPIPSDPLPGPLVGLLITLLLLPLLLMFLGVRL